MNIKDKLTIVANAIYRVRTTLEGQEEIELFITEKNQLNQFEFKEIELILNKLVSQGVLESATPEIPNSFLLVATKGINALNDPGTGAYFRVTVGESFDNWVQKNHITIQKVSEKMKNPEEVVYEIKFTDGGEILINDILFKKPQINSDNFEAFDFISKNSNRPISNKEFQEQTGLNIDFNKLVNRLGFKDNLRKAFFNSATKSIIEFINPVTRQRLNELGITRLKLQ